MTESQPKRTLVQYGVAIKEAALHGRNDVTYEADMFDSPEEVYTALGWARVALLNAGIAYPFTLTVDIPSRKIFIQKGDQPHPRPTEPYEGTALSAIKRRSPTQIPSFVTNLTDPRRP